MIHDSSRFSWILAGFILTLAFVSCGEDRKPNMVVLILDTTRADSLGSAWGGASVTPNLDKIAREGVRFTHAVAPAPWTVPSHASLFTGLYPHQHNTVHGNFKLSDNLETLAERLRTHGYETAGISCNPWLHSGSGMQQGFDSFIETCKHDEEEKDKGARLATEMAIQWLEERVDKDKPYLLFINYLEPHLPLEPPQEILDRFALQPGVASWQDYSVERAERFIAGLEKLTEEELDQVRRLYAAEVAYLDLQVAELVKVLRAQGQMDNTVLVITSDHGEHLGEQRLMGHEFTLFEPVLRVPLVIRYPDLFPPDRVSDAAVSLIDIYPTLLQILGDRNVNSGLRGQSLVDLMDKPTEKERLLFAEYTQPTRLVKEHWQSKYPEVDMSPFNVSLKMVRKGDFKYVVSGTGREALYNLAEDPHETTNVAHRFPEKLAELQAEMKNSGKASR